MDNRFASHEPWCRGGNILTTKTIVIKKNFIYIFYSFIAVVFSFLIHEFTHWTMGELLGYKMAMTLNIAYPLSGSFTTDRHYTLVSAVGPLITLLQTIVVYFLIKKTAQKNLYPFIFSSFYIELLSGIMNYRNPNDLGRISTTFGLGLFTIPVIVVLIHLFFLYKTSIREKYTVKLNLLTLLWVLLISSIWILTNQQFHVRII